MHLYYSTTYLGQEHMTKTDSIHVTPQNQNNNSLKYNVPLMQYLYRSTVNINHLV